MKRFPTIFIALLAVVTITSCKPESPPDPQITGSTIHYTTNDGDILFIKNGFSHFGANIISNTYESGMGVITFDNDITQIGGGAFLGYSNLTSIKFHNGVDIQHEAFAWCINLASVTIPDGPNQIGSRAFLECTSLKTIVIPNGVIEIKPEAFSGCTGIKSVTIPNTVRNIGWGAFSQCSSLESLTISNGVTAISGDAFSWCTSLKSVTLPNSITYIYYYAFNNCSSLESIYVKSVIPPDIGTLQNSSTTFNNNAPNRKFYVPAASVDAYKKAKGWSRYASAIVAE